MGKYYKIKRYVAVSGNLEKLGVTENLRDLPEYEFKELLFRRDFINFKKNSERTCLQRVVL